MLEWCVQEIESEELDNQLLEPAPVPSTVVPTSVPAAAQASAMPNVPSSKVMHACPHLTHSSVPESYIPL